MFRFRPLLIGCLATVTLSAQVDKLDPTIEKIVSEVSQDHITDSLKHLTGFETRGNFSDPAQQNRGIGAARRWIYDQFRSYSPRLEVSFDPYKVKKQGTRILRDVEVVNVVAVLPGTTQPGKRLIVGGHYDTVNIVRKAGLPAPTGTGSDPSVDDSIDFEKSIEAVAPGAQDDATGTALVLELARVMSQYKFEKTIVFVTFAGEELGLIGSTLYADKAKERHDDIEAMFNNDIVGNDMSGNGHKEGGLVHVFSEDPDDSPSRELARYIRDAAQRYVPGFRAELVFRNDRFGRGGDHTGFNQNGFTAIRFTTAAENLESQHTANDTLEKVSPAYNTDVAKVNAAGLASLALAPSAPLTMREITTGSAKGRKTPNLGRGKSHYDAVLRWEDPKPAADLAGYAVVERSTTAPYWDHQIFVGKVNEFTLPETSIDDVVFGVKAIDVDGHESLVAPFVNPPAAPKKPIELQN
ncbi:MAG TPA: M20/M25/M40 family metallo-hydrolase [Bryobacteraceae bacterium]|nr:M20/M25/M40 family metallo-hydrolase [Bryobacteraceae bacterium]